MDTILVGVIADIPAPLVSCLQIDEDILFDWELIPGFDEYEINVITNGNATGWTGPITGNQYLASGLSNGDEITVEVRVFFDNPDADCEVPVGSSSCMFSRPSCGRISGMSSSSAAAGGGGGGGGW